MTFADDFFEVKRILETSFKGLCYGASSDESAIGPDDEVTLSLHSGNNATCSASRVASLVSSARDGQLQSNGLFVGENILIARVVPSNGAARVLCDGFVVHSLSERILRYENEEIDVWLDHGVTELSLHYSAREFAHELFPEFGADWMFLCAVRKSSRSLSIGDLVAYLFSLEESHGLSFVIEEFPVISDEEYLAMFPHDETVLGLAVGSIKPLLSSEFEDLLVAYLEACSLPSPRYQILGFARVIEYVATSVEKYLKCETQKIISEVADVGVKARLVSIFSKRVRRPTDADLIAQAVETVADPLRLLSLAPPILKKLSLIRPGNVDRDRSGALAELSKVLSATRNEVAHAKANYSSKSDECPVDQLPQFAALLRVLAQQAIYWLQRQDPAVRVIGRSEQ